jgi:hypothetical protein
VLKTELERLGVRFHERGHVTCWGPSLALSRRLDALFLDWASAWRAEEFCFPPFMSARDLGRTDYFNSFQHLATFPVSLPAEEATLAAFGERNQEVECELALGPTAAVQEVLTPAACYHVYAHLQGAALAEPRYVTTKCTCYRREAEYRALERQWSFTMREIVCVADAATVKEFLAAMQARLTSFFDAMKLPISFEPATDPFFRGRKHPKHFAQQLDPVKFEMIFAGRLAIGSINFHRNYFGEAFDIRQQGAAAFSGCVAFGVERWMHAVVSCFGADPANWPVPFALGGAS